MARAKRTDRAEARRRYRASVAELEADVADDEPEDAPSAGRSDARRGAARSDPPTPARPGERMSIRRAFGLAMQPANIREDLAALPWLVRSTKAVWVPTAIVAITGLLYVAAPRQAVIATIATTLLAPPSLIPPFLAGLLAPRAAWLAGLIVGFVSGLAVVIVTLAQTGLGLTSAEVTTEALLFFVAVSPMFGLGVGAFAGFYRRFLRFTAPPPGARRRGSAKPAPRGR